MGFVPLVMREISLGPPDELGLKEIHGYAQNVLTCVVNIILYLLSLILDQERDFDQTQG